MSLEGVVGPDEVGLALGEVAEGAHAAAAHGVEDAEATARGAAPESSGEDAEIAADGALAAEEGVAGLELDAPLLHLGPRCDQWLPLAAKLSGSRAFIFNFDGKWC